MPGDRSKSAARKLKHTLETWDPALQADVSWQVWMKCELCGQEICVNNYHDRQTREPRFMGKLVCPWCKHRGGKNHVRALVVAEKLAKIGCLKVLAGKVERAPEECKCLGCVTRRLFGAPEDDTAGGSSGQDDERERSPGV